MTALAERPDSLAHVEAGDTGRKVPIPGTRPWCGHRVRADRRVLASYPCNRAAGHPGQHIASTMTEVLAVAPRGGEA